MKTIAITGSNGFIGKHLVSYFSASGNAICALQRSIPDTLIQENVTYVKYSIEEGFDEDEVNGCDALVHCAYVAHAKCKNSNLLNWNSLKRLLSYCRAKQIKLVYFSTMAAHEEATSNYGMHKLLGEKMCDPTKDLVLKCGLVMAPDGGFIFDLGKYLSKTKFVPLFGGGRQLLQSIDMSELFQIVRTGIEEDISGIYPVGEEQPFSMEDLYRTISEGSQFKNIFFRVPISPVLFLARVAEAVGIRLPKLPITVEGLLGLQHVKAFDTKEIRNTFGVAITPFRDNIYRYSQQWVWN